MKSLITKFRRSVGEHAYYYEKRLEISKVIEPQSIHHFADTSPFWSINTGGLSLRLEFEL